jgi:hypothetical protein
MDELYKVVLAEQTAIYRQVIQCRDKRAIPVILQGLHELLAEEKFHGTMHVNYQQGGITNIVTEQVVRIREGSDADQILEREFARAGNNGLTKNGNGF